MKRAIGYSQSFGKGDYMALEIVGEVLVEGLKLVGRVLFELLFEVFIRGTGYWICRIFSNRVKIDDNIVAVIGLLFWIGLPIGLITLWPTFT
jgi:hypothetical protein